MDEKNLTLVTGASGFLGSWIVRTLVERGHPVRAFVRAQSDLQNLTIVRDHIELAYGDILDRASLIRAMEGCHALIHTAGTILTHPRAGARAWAMHYTGAINAFTAARATKLARIVYTASIFTLGAGAREHPANEAGGRAFVPKNFRYCDAKLAAQKFAEASNLPIVFVYPTFCFGPGDVHLSSQRALVAYLRGKLFGVTNTGINVIDVRDAARGHAFALTHGRLGEKYLLAGENIPLCDLFARAGRLAGVSHLPRVFPRALLPLAGWLCERVMREPPLDYATAQIAQQWWYYDGTRSARELGLITRPLDDTLRDAIAWFRAQQLI